MGETQVRTNFIADSLDSIHYLGPIAVFATLSPHFPTRKRCPSLSNSNASLPKPLSISVRSDNVSRFTQKMATYLSCSQQWQQKKKKERKRPTVLRMKWGFNIPDNREVRSWRFVSWFVSR